MDEMSLGRELDSGGSKSAKFTYEKDLCKEIFYIRKCFTLFKNFSLSPAITTQNRSKRWARGVEWLENG